MIQQFFQNCHNYMNFCSKTMNSKASVFNIWHYALPLAFLFLIRHLRGYGTVMALKAVINDSSFLYFFRDFGGRRITVWSRACSTKVMKLLLNGFCEKRGMYFWGETLCNDVLIKKITIRFVGNTAI